MHQLKVNAILAGRAIHSAARRKLGVVEGFIIIS